jgi:thioredoxin 1
VANANVFNVTDQDFQASVLDSKEPVLVDFWAEWCGPCKTLAPTIDELANDFSGKVKVVKMDIDANPLVPAEFGIRSIPSVLVFKGGELLETLVGRKNKDAYAEILKKHSD